MKTVLQNLWHRLSSTYWLVPSVMGLIAAGLAIGMIQIDLRVEMSKWLTDWFYGGSPSGAREMLGTIAGSMITIAGVSFSIMLVALSLASSQFGPRLLNSFMRDRGNQIVLGMFIATFLYCLLVLETIRSEQGDIFVPHLAITVALAMTVVSIGFLIFFIHHVAVSIQAAYIIQAVSEDLNEVINRVFPIQVGKNVSPARQRYAQRLIPPEFQARSQPVAATFRSGYLQAINAQKLMRVAQEHELLIELMVSPGDFVTQGTEIARAWPSEKVNWSLAKKINDALTLGMRRTPTQDIRFVIDELVEIASRALSPGVNDPFTATMCIDRIAAGLAKLAERIPPSPYRFNGDNALRLIIHPVKFSDLADAAFDQIRIYGASDVVVMMYLLGRMQLIAERIRHPEDRQAMLRHVKKVRQQALIDLKNPDDRERVRQAARRVMRQLSMKTKGKLDNPE